MRNLPNMRRAQVFAALLGALIVCKATSAATCENIKSVRLEHTMITSAAVVPAGTFVPPQAEAGPIPPTAFASLPEFCRVAGFIAPTTDSHIGFEVWLPTRGWDGRYMGV